MTTAKVNVYQFGNTVRLQCKFFDYEGLPIDPTITKVIIYNSKYEPIITEIVGAINKINIGEYFFDYTTEKKEQKLYYEWYGEIDGTPSLKRGTFLTKFM